MLVNLLTPYSGETYPETLSETIDNKVIRYVPFEISKDLDDIYTWQYILVNSEYYNYKDLVDILIGLKYNLSDMLAIMNNYMDEPKNETYKKEFKEMQEWRKKSKKMAKEHFGIDN